MKRHLNAIAVVGLLAGLLVGSLLSANGGNTALAGSSGAPKKAVVGRISIEGLVADLNIQGYQWGLELPGATIGGGGAGKAAFQDFAVATELNAASVPLFLAAAQGHSSPSARVVIFQPGSTNPLMVYQLTDVLIVALNDGVGTADQEKPLETVRFKYSTIKLTFSAPGGPISGGWDVAQNQPLP